VAKSHFKVRIGPLEMTPEKAWSGPVRIEGIGRGEIPSKDWEKSPNPSLEKNGSPETQKQWSLDEQELWTKPRTRQNLNRQSNMGKGLHVPDTQGPKSTFRSQIQILNSHPASGLHLATCSSLLSVPLYYE
jgi:hypothetical protein